VSRSRLVVAGHIAEHAGSSLILFVSKIETCVACRVSLTGCLDLTEDVFRFAKFVSSTLDIGVFLSHTKRGWLVFPG